MMTEKYPTWLTGHVKEWAQKRLPTVTLCSTTGNELLEVWYYGDLLTLNEEPQLYIVPVSYTHLPRHPLLGVICKFRFHILLIPLIQQLLHTLTDFFGIWQK